MPPVSKAQNRFMHAHEDDAGPLGKVAQDYTADQSKGSVKNLPERVKPKNKARPATPKPFGSLAP
jgi:hypothetical protein